MVAELDKPEPDADGEGSTAAAQQTDPEPTDEAALLEEVERHLFAGDYQAIAELLGPHERATQLTPPLVVIYATALKELGEDENADETNRLAIGAMAEILGVEPNSRTALMFAKRMLRTHHPGWQAREAPKAPARVALIVVGIVFGGVVGWLVGPGGVQLVEILKAMW